jgi:putative ABC transport system permease protein
MARLVRDLKFGCRFLVRNIGFTIVAVGCLGLGIGANTAVFSAAYAVVLRQLPYPEAASLVEVRITRFTPTVVDSKMLPIPKSDDLIAQTQTLRAVGRYIPASVTITGQDEPEQLSGLLVTAAWFDALATEPVVGRRLIVSDMIEDHDNVAVISHAFWTRRFGRSPDAVGKEIVLSAQPTGMLLPFALKGRPFTIVGVMPERARFPADGEIWLPLRTEKFTTTMGTSPRQVRNVGIVARVRPGVSNGRVNDELRTISDRLATQYPETDSNWQLRAITLRNALTERYSAVVGMLVVAVNLILILACVCISGLLVARNRRRQKEVAIRQTLGGSRATLIQQFLSESVLLGVLGGGFGTILAYWLMGAIRLLAPATIPRIEELRLDTSMLMYTVCISVGAGVLVGLAPAIQLTTPQLGTAMKDYQSRAQASAGGYRFRLRGLLIGLEIALVFPTVIAAVLMLRTVANLTRVEVGFDTTHVLAVTTRLSSTTCSKFDACTAAIDQILDRLRGLPGVDAVSISGTRPFAGAMALPVTTEKAWDAAHPGGSVVAEYQIVTRDYFRTLSVPIRTGRGFTDADVKGAPLVAVVNQTFAKRLFGGPAVGRVFSLAPAGKSVWLQIVGEVPDVRDLSLTKEAQPTFFVPLAQANLVPRTVVLLRAKGTPLALAAPVADQIHAVDANAPITSVDTLDSILAQQVAEPRFQAFLLALFAGVGVVLAVLGVYGLISYATSDRLQEFGIRLALGAQPRDILRLVMIESVSTLAWGLTFGMAAAVGLSQYIRSQLYDVSSTDPRTFVGVAVMLTLAALSAYFVPARKATRVDPLIALRYE